MSAQLPANPGTWPSFWMRPVNPASNVGEIDIMEAYTQFQNSYCATLHDWANTANSVGNCPNSVVEVGNPPNPALSTGYHVYAMRWTPTMVSFYFDGQLIWQHPPLHPAMDGPYYLLFDLGIGGGWPTTQTRSPSVMKIKYIQGLSASVMARHGTRSCGPSIMHVPSLLGPAALAMRDVGERQQTINHRGQKGNASVRSSHHDYCNAGGVREVHYDNYKRPRDRAVSKYARTAMLRLISACALRYRRPWVSKSYTVVRCLVGPPRRK